MTPIADMIERMVAGGVAMDFILLAVRTAELSTGKSAESPVDKSAERRRAYDRERKAAKRNSAESPVEIRGTSADADSALSVSSSPQEPEHRKQEAKKERAPRDRGHRIPPGWRPSEDHYLEAAALGFQRPWVDGQAKDMRIWGDANAHRAVARKLDWDLTFSGWMRRTGGNSAQQHQGNRHGKRTVHDAANDLLERVRSFDEPAPSGVRDGEGQGAVRRLSAR